MTRYAAPLAALAVLVTAGCGASPRTDAATTSPTPQTSSVSPVSSTARAPAPCLDEQLTIHAHWQRDGATGTTITSATVLLVAGEACTLEGFPQVRLLDAQGRRLPLAYHHTKQPSRPVVLTRDEPAVLTLSKYRCDLASSSRSTGSARIVLPGLATRRVVPAADLLPICAPRDPSHIVVVWPIAEGSTPTD